jgi:hypothetical protein
MIRAERLHRIEEESYKKGGKVRKSKSKKKKAKKPAMIQTVTVNVSGGGGGGRGGGGGGRGGGRGPRPPPRPSPLRGGGGGGGSQPPPPPPSLPSYFRAVPPEQQTFASLPGSLKALEEQQRKFFNELEKQKEQGRTDARMAEAEGKQEISRGPALPAVFSTAVVPSPIQTLTPLERPRNATPGVSTPVLSSQSLTFPRTAIRPPYPYPVPPYPQSSMSSREAGYRGADETLPIQAPASGADMKPARGDVVEFFRSTQPAPGGGYFIPGSRTRVVMRKKGAKPATSVQTESSPERQRSSTPPLFTPSGAF